MCFSPDWRRDIHNNFIIPFKTLEHDVYCDQPADATEFGLSSVVLTKFRKSKRSKLLWEGIVRNYWQSYNFRKRKMTPYKIFVRTAYLDLGIKHQYTEEFHPSQVRLKGITIASSLRESLRVSHRVPAGGSLALVYFRLSDCREHE